MPGPCICSMARPVPLITTLTGSQPGDFVGTGGVTALTNGNYVVISPYWGNGAVDDVGAVTWGNGTTGISGPVSPANSRHLRGYFLLPAAPLESRFVGGAVRWVPVDPQWAPNLFQRTFPS